MEDGDQNTKLFDLATVIRRRTNHIASIQTSDSSFATDYESIGAVFSDHFSTLFSSVVPICPSELQGLFPTSLSSQDCMELQILPSDEEIKAVVFSMSNGKSPGPDGLTPLFFKFYRDIVTVQVIKAVQFFFSHGSLIRPLNHTFIALIPKRANPSLVDHFRPISLCNVIYKIITKILANRIKPLLSKIVSPFQCAFIPGRTMTDSVITCHELMHHINRKKGSLHLMVVKIDLAKAYDKVEWAVLTKILQLHGFPLPFIALIMECISTASFLVLINGSPFGLFHSSRGLRQGDPLSPALFVLFIDLLSQMLLRAEAVGDIHGVKIGRHCPTISHLLFIDDATIFCRASVVEATRLAALFRQFGEWSEQSVNWEKSLIHFSKDTPLSIRGDICTVLRIPKCTHRSAYLGNPFCKPPSKRAAFNGLVDKLKDRMCGWRGRLLSQAGRLILIKSVVESSTQHSIQSFLWPKNIAAKVDKLTCDFFWGFKEPSGHHLYLRSWHHLCTPRQQGGLGLRTFHDINQAFVAKLGWQLLSAHENTWTSLFRAKYLKGLRFQDLPHCPQSASWIMRGIWLYRDILLRNVCYQIGHRSELSIFDDPWVPHLIGFRPPRPPDWPHALSKVFDLMISDSSSWDILLL